MNPSFQNKSSSDDISETDAFVQISEEDILVGGNKSCELVEPSSCRQFQNEVHRTDLDECTDLGCNIPTDQVPALRETVDSTEMEGCSGMANLAAVSKSKRTQMLVHAAATELYSKEETIQHHLPHHKMQRPLQVWSSEAAIVHHDSPRCERGINETHPGSVMSCQCLQFQNHPNLKLEAVDLKTSPGQHQPQQSCWEAINGGVGGGVGAGPLKPEPNGHHLTSSEVESSFSESVISSSISAAVKDVKLPPSLPTSSSPTTPPSLCGSSGTIVGSTCSAEQTSNANLVIHRGSSCSESLLHAQIQSENLGALPTQASDNQVNSSEVQNQEAVMQPSVNSSLGNREGNCSSSNNICINLKGPLITSNVKQIGAHSDIPIDAAVAGRQYYPKNEGIIKSSFNKISYGGLPKQLSWSSYPQGPASNEGWGIPRGLGLLGGGESSLNSGTSGWGTAPSSNPNNNSGWGQNSSQNNPAQSQWGSGSVNRNGGGASQGPGGQQNAGNSGKGNQQTHQQSHSQGGGPQQQQSGQSSNSVSSRDSQGQQGGGQQNTQQQPGGNGPASQSSLNQQQQNGSTSWAQAAGKGLPGGPSTQGTGGGGSGSNGGPNGGSTSNSTTKQLEQLNSMREALFSQDGWGGQHVNQDTGWDIPASPEPGAKDSGAVWKPNVNNGTDLWEANLRNGGQPPPQQAQKTPWGHTPASNIGGTWGEDDDVGDSSNVWTGVPSSGGGGGGGGGAGMGAAGGPGASGPGPGGAGAGGQWTGGSGGGAMWGAKKEPEWGPAGSNWGDSRDSRELRGGDPRDIRSGDPRDIRDVRELRGGDIRGGGDHRGAVDHRGVDPRDLRELRDPLMRDMRDMRDLPRDLRGGGNTGDPRMGRINGGDMGGSGAAAAVAAAAAMWSQQKGVGSSGGGVVGGPSQWAGPPPPQPKDMKSTGWEEPSPPTQRRTIPNYDDGTSLWGNPTQQPGKGETRKVSHWKEMPTPNMGRGGMQCPPGISQNRLPPGGSGGMKGDGSGPLWGHPSRNGSWGDTPHDTGNSGWGDDSKVGMGGGGVSSWNEPQLNPSSWGGQKPKPSMNPSGWGEDNMDGSSWSHNPKAGPKTLTKELVWASKQFRILSEIGYKKEDVEIALRTTNMNLEDAHDLLNSGRLNLDAWRRHEDHSPFDLATASHPNAAVAAVTAAAAAAGVFPGQRFNPVTQQMPYAPPGPGVGNAPSLLNNLNNANPSLASINNISPAMVQKILSQQPPPQQPPSQQPTSFQPTPRAPQNQPSAAQLRMLVQQIQMAVQAGYLNHQILNQPLAPQTLILLNQLLQQIKLLQQLMQQQTIIQVSPMGKGGGSHTVLHISVQITKAKQQITNLQNQIAAQQAIYVKQQQQQQHHMAATQGGGAGPHSGGDYFKPPMHDPMATLQGNFGELAIKDPQVQASYQNQQSRLNQWKLPSLDKEGDVGAGSEFSRAPGTTSKSTLPQPNSSPNINPILGQGDGTWSTVSRSSSDTGWPETSSNPTVDVVGAQTDNKDSQWPTSVAPTNSAAFTDLVPEFEPGKPWKGTQMKSIEDDPTITPGSVVRSPLSLPNIKDTEIFGGSGGGGGSVAVVGGSGSKPSMPAVTSAVDAPIPPLSLSSSTWSFNPTSSAAPSSSFTSPLGSKIGGSKSSWGDAPPPTPVTSELWGAPVGKSRGPPPGLSSKAASNGWGSLGGGNSGSSAVRSSVSSTSSSWGIQGAPWGSTWLLLRNLTPQIDGSTLKTLCLQHGPLQSFHLYLNHELALAKYSTREEAAKAQGALNNCVLGNTTIFAESPGESEVHSLLQHLGHGAQQQQQQGGSSTPWGIRGAGAAPQVVSSNPQAHFAPVAPNSQSGQPPSKAASDAWSGGGGSQLWPSPSASSLWGAPPLDGGNDQHRATPSSLNSFLPGDLLGGESM
ncbi:protein Gawky isoform X1 [Hetaerina americana]|uniref:protein Gawky isoform X1 n=1 Tax=Hetaerina americana TaxID=62018 RepID=UPI003A7F566D